MKITLNACEKNATKMLQDAFDKVYLAGGGVVELEAGVYNTGAFRIRSNTTLILKKGVLIKGSRNTDDYDILRSDELEPLTPEEALQVEWERSPVAERDSGWLRAPASRWNNALIRVLHARNVAIIGEEGSIIDGMDPFDELGEEHFRGPHGISIQDSENVLCKGYIIQNTGNWAHIVSRSVNLSFDKVTMLAGHDGIHCNGCDNIRIENCDIRTGDDCIAGFDNRNMVAIHNKLNTACSAFRFGGTNAVIRDCEIYGPAEYRFRNRLTKEEQIQGIPSPKDGVHHLLSVFTYYADFTYDIREIPGNILMENCTCKNADRIVNFDYSGNNRWQYNKPLTSLTIRNCQIEGATIPLYLYGDEALPLCLNITDCKLAFDTPVDNLCYAKNCKELKFTNLKVSGVTDGLIKSWGNCASPICENVEGVNNTVTETNEEWKFRCI